MSLFTTSKVIREFPGQELPENGAAWLWCRNICVKGVPFFLGDVLGAEL